MAWMTSILKLTCLLFATTHLFTIPISAQSSPAPYLRTPSSRQLSWHRLEFYAFLHFGPNTFTNEEWGRSQTLPDIFAPTSLDIDQWARTFSDAGMAGMILTAKHHDGMALWDTNTTTYKIGNGKWAKDRVGKGLDADVVRMAAQSAKKFGLKFGVYLSPWDIHRDPAMPKTQLSGTAFDEPQIFGNSSPGDYNEFYSQQLTELVTMQLGDGEKVELFEIWLDGASGSNTVQTFDWAKFRDIIRLHQPDAIMWGHQGVDARWVGNEDGATVVTNWHTISRTQDQTRYNEAQLQTGVRDGTYWTPAEADARLRSGWFWHAGERPKMADALMDMYLKSVGRSVNLLLDVPPDTSGQIPKEDLDVLLKFKAQRDAFFGLRINPSSLIANASSVREGNYKLYGPLNVLDSEGSTYWAMNDNEKTGSLVVTLNSLHTIEAFIVQEHIALGQRIGGYAIDAFVDGAWKTIVTGTSIGYKRIDRPSTKVKTNGVRLRITQANAAPLIHTFQVLGMKH
ncbi:alpha-L-fucosidase 1 [Lojkania enalia]|uniref:alpha-L-fucosidase n=1 Tax=Lojkania enalia TaxID=147567 RepID=A0A9P4TQB2_9PLEO|nr:alpha-L-fucosidase 1 [Didymosphaeria enalia]